MGIFCNYKFLMDIWGYICFCFLILREKIACNCGGGCGILLGVAGQKDVRTLPDNAIAESSNPI
jgi:hypothetical protein